MIVNKVVNASVCMVRMYSPDIEAGNFAQNNRISY